MESQATGIKAVDENLKESLQPRARASRAGYGGLLSFLASGSYRVSPWWSPQRDKDLQNFVHDSDHLASSVAMLVAKVAAVPVKVMSRDMRLKSHQRDAEEYTIKLNEESEFGRGWQTLVSRALQDFWCCDNGMFLEIIGDGKADGPITGPAMGIANLDSHRCQRTGDIDFPVVYYPADGGIVKLHRTRVAFAADMPSAREEMYGVGYSAVSRVLNNVQTLVDIGRYKQEKLGSRPLRAILQGKGISTDAILDAIAISEEQMDSRGLSIFSQIPVLGDMAPDAGLELMSLVGLPDGYEEETSIRLAMFLIALGFGVPIRWLWPAAVSGATKADAMYSHIAGLGGGVGMVLSILTMQLGGDPRGLRHGIGKFLPAHLKLIFDFQDDEQDRSRAEIQGLRGRNRKTELEAGVIDLRVAREQALGADDISKAQFDRLELGDGRLPGGESVLTLFHNTKEPFLSWLDLGVDNPLAVAANDPMEMLDEINVAAIRVQDAIANNSNVTLQERAEQAQAALDALKALYAPLAQQSIQQSLLSGYGNSMGGAPAVPGAEGAEAGTEEVAAEGEAPAEAESLIPAVEPEAEEEASVAEEEVPVTEEEAPAEAEKAFNYGVGVGQIISGQLARGAGGKFVNAADMLAGIQAQMIARMSGAGAINSASQLRGKNRAKIAAALGISPGLLDGLAGMKSGETSAEVERALADAGLAEVNPDGSISMSQAGAAVLRAANSGDVDAAEQAKAKADRAKAGGTGKGKAGGAAKKPTKEQQQTANREKTKTEVGERLGPELFSALMSFADGGDLSPSQIKDLAQRGLVEVDKDGFAKLSSAGRGFVSSANRADIRSAEDAVSTGAEVVEAKREKVDNLRLQAQAYKDKAEQVYPEAEEQVARLKENAVKLYDRTMTSLERLEDRMQKAEERAQKLQERADALDAEADGAQNPERADQLRTIATKLRDESDKVVDSIFDMQSRYQDTVENVNNQLATMQKNAATIMENAETTQGAYNLRSEQLSESAKELEDSIGGAEAPSGVKSAGGLLQGLRRFFGGRKQAVAVRGVPLPEWDADTVEVSEADLDAAVKAWNDDPGVPRQARNLLAAKLATSAKVAEAEARGEGDVG